MKIYCISASVITALVMALSVFLGNVGHTEYKSQLKKRKIKKSAFVLENTITDTSDEYVDVQLV